MLFYIEPRRFTLALDTEVKAYLEAYYASNPPPYSSFTPDALRKTFNESFAKKPIPKPIPMVSEIEKTLQGKNAEFTVKVFIPSSGKNLSGCLYFHGGGYVIRDNMEVYSHTCRRIAQQLNSVVCAVDYHLAPEFPFPAAVEDCYSATCWFIEHAKEFNINPNKIAVWGESSGGGLSAVIPILLRNRNGPRVALQILITPITNDDFATPSYIENEKGYFLTLESMQWFLNHYLSKEEDWQNPLAFPLKAKDLSNLPPAIVVGCEYDPLRDDAQLYAEKLQSFNNEVDYVCYDGLIHGFFDLLDIKVANRACDDIFNRVHRYMHCL